MQASDTRLVLIRHGESRATIDRVIGGPAGCKGLSAHGVRQAEALRDRLAATKELARTDVLLASTLPRAAETAQIIAPALGGHAVRQDKELCELDPGSYDGMSWEEYEERGFGFDVAAEPFRPMGPGGESWADFMVRVGRALSEIAARHRAQEVVIVCHGGVIEGSLRTLLSLGWPGTARMLAAPANTSLTEWRYHGGEGARVAWELCRFNDAAHLDEQGVPR